MRALFAVFVSFMFLAGCSPKEEADKLPTTTIVVDTQKGPVILKVEVADSPAARERGLMYRTELAPDAGMLFEFDAPAVQTFWMKNTPLSLDMIFVRSDGTIATIATNTIPYSEDRITSGEPIEAVIEINGGRADALGIAPGDTVHAAMFGNGS